ncbi:MAG TPA: response regulator [Candidatus Nitrosocosmicus sp.]|nr:response regulator [Candidatus Nitrosocosmicus sp.]
MNKKVLVIDDDEGILEATQLMLEVSGYDVETSVNGDVLKKMKMNKPDLILLDYFLSGTDGCQIAKKLKSKEETKNIPIIMISAHPNAKQDMEDVDINGFIPKPFDMYTLLDQIKANIN